MIDLESHGVLLTLILSFIGFIITFLVSYLKFLNEFNFIKGQISQLLEIHEGFTGLIERHVKMETDILKTFKDLDKAFLRIKFLETTILNGGKH